MYFYYFNINFKVIKKALVELEWSLGILHGFDRIHQHLVDLMNLDQPRKGFYRFLCYFFICFDLF